MWGSTEIGQLVNEPIKVWTWLKTAGIQKKKKKEFNMNFVFLFHLTWSLPSLYLTVMLENYILTYIFTA